MTDDAKNLSALDRDLLEQMLSECRSRMDSCPEEAIGIAESVIEKVRDGKAPDIYGKGLAYLSRAIANTEGAAKSLELARKAVEVLSDPENRELCAMALNNLGNCNRRSFNLLDAMGCYSKAEAIYNQLNNIRGIALVNNGMAQTYRLLGLNEKAYRSFSRSGELAASVEYDLLQAISLSNLAEMLLEQRDFDTAEKYLREGLSLNTRIDRKMGIGICLESLGRLEQNRNNLVEAEKYFRQAVSVWQEVGSHRHMVSSYCNLAEILELKQDTEATGELLERAVEVAECTDMPEVLWVAKGRLAAYNVRVGRTENVEENLLKVIEILEDTGEQGLDKSKACKVLARYYENTGRFADALKIYRKGSKIEKAVMDHEIKHDVVRLKMQDEFRRSEEQRSVLDKQRIELENANRQLKEALDRIRKLKQLLPICAKCKKIRNDEGYWEQIDAYITEHSETVFSHGLCPECASEMYRELVDLDE